jgi:hypothetical protein
MRKGVLTAGFIALVASAISTLVISFVNPSDITIVNLSWLTSLQIIIIATMFCIK